MPSSWASLVALTVKNLPAMLGTQVRSLGCEAPLEKEMETHSDILAWEISWTEEPGGLQFMGVTKEFDMNEGLLLFPLLMQGPTRNSYSTKYCILFMFCIF